MTFRTYISILCTLILLSCSKVEPESYYLQKATQKALTEDANYTVKDFIWRGLNQYYLWQPQQELLSDTRFSPANATNPAYVNFLKSFSSNELLFNSLKYEGDRFSYITDNYEELEEELQGALLSTGMEFGIAQLTDMNNIIIGYVRYVIPNSDAEKQGVKRGDIFLEVDGEKLSTENYQRLLRDNKNKSITFSFYTISDGGFQFSAHKIISQHTLHENPILLHKILQKGDKKIGYLLYNSFLNRYDKELNEVFGTFKSGGVTDLVLDLRYNPGGSVQTAIYLASMIAGTDTQKLFVRQTSNPKMKGRWKSDYAFEDNIAGTPIHSLKLSSVYILTSRQTASASELIINGLKPYLKVIQIGDVTVGKPLASITIKDTKNKDNKWAMQPIVLRSENANGFGAYENGIAPDIFLREQLGRLGVLGDENEPLLAKAIEEITGVPRFTASTRSRRSTRTKELSFKDIDNSRSSAAYYNRMYIPNQNTDE